MSKILYPVLSILFWQCANHRDDAYLQTDEIRDEDISLKIVDTLIIQGITPFTWIATTDNGGLGLLYNSTKEEVIHYDIEQKAILKTYAFNTAPTFDKLISATFFGSTPILISDRNIYKWTDESLEVVALNEYYKPFLDLISPATILVDDNDTSLVFNMSKNLPTLTPKTRDIDSIKYSGEYLTLRRLSTSAIEHIGYLPPNSILLSPEVLKEPRYDLNAYHVNWRNQLGIIFSPENTIHLYKLKNNGYEYTSSMEIPIPDYRIINRHLDKVSDNNFRYMMYPRIHSTIQNSQKILLHYLHAVTEEKIEDHNLYHSSLFGIKMELFFSLRNQSVMIYSISEEKWINQALPKELSTIVAILPNNTYIASANPHLVEMDSGQLFYIVKIE